MREKALATMLALSMAAVGLAGRGSSDTATTTQAPAAAEAPATTQTPAADAGTEAAAPAAGSGELVRVGIINNNPSESGYRTTNDADLKAMLAKKNGYDVSFAYGLESDEQIAAAQKFVRDGAGYLLLSAADASGWDGMLKDTQDAGIGTILFDRTIDASGGLYLASIVSDMNREGDTAVKQLADQSSDGCNVIYIRGVMGSAAQQGRTGTLDTEVATGASQNLITQQTAEWSSEKAQQTVQSAVDSDTKLNVICAENDGMAGGAVVALDKTNISHGIGRDIIIMGFDCNKWAFQELLDQDWNYGGQCNPFQAAYIDEVTKKVENGEILGEKTIITRKKGFDATTITAGDVKKYGT